MTPNKRDLKAYVRFDGTGRIVPGSLVLRRSIPKNGNWKEITAYECCNSLGPIQRCTINVNEDQPDPYSVGGGPYFAMERGYFPTNFPYTFTLNSLNINGVDYASGQVLTLNSPAELVTGIGFDGRTYFMNIVDWLNPIIPSSTGVVLYDDMNTIDRPVNTLFAISITVSYYEGSGGPLVSRNYYYNQFGFYADDPGDNSQGLYTNCTTL
jgi:hypothetical protein